MLEPRHRRHLRPAEGFAVVRGIVIASGIAMFIGLIHSAAMAHSHLKTSVPAAGATVAAGQSEIRLQFDAAIEPRFSKISIELKGGWPVASEPATSDPADKTILIAKFAQPLQAGTYNVNWHAVSADTHKVKGSFTFQVRP